VAAVVYHHDLSIDGGRDSRDIVLRKCQVVLRAFNGNSSVQFHACTGTFRVFTYF